MTRRRGYFARHAPPARRNGSTGGRSRGAAKRGARFVHCRQSTFPGGARSRTAVATTAGKRRRDDGMANALEQRVVITDSAPLLAPGIDLLRSRGVTVDVRARRHGCRRDRGGRGRRAGGDRRRASRCAARRSTALRSTGLLIRAGIGYDIIDVRGRDGEGHLGRQRARLLRRRGRRPRGAAPDVGLASAVRARARLARGQVGQSRDHAADPPDARPAPRRRGVRADRAGGRRAGPRVRLGGRRVRPVPAGRRGSGGRRGTRSASTSCSRRPTPSRSTRR